MPYNSGKEEEQSRKLFVGGISQETSDEIMNEYFSKFGSITDCVVIREQSTNRSKGFGFVTFENETEADACMNKRPHSLDNRQIDVKRAVSREESSKPGAHVQVKKIFIGGIKEGCDENALREYFGKFGSINSCEIPLNNEQRPKGFAFVTYNDFDIVDKLVAKRHHTIAGINCEVKKALSKQEMEKAKQQLEMKQQSRPRRGGGGGSNYHGNGGSNYHGNGYQGYDDYDSGDYNHGYGSYGDGYGSYGSYSDGYGSGYGGNSSGYGPMKGQYGQQQSRASGPYGSGYGSGNYAGGGGGGYDSGYGGYGSYSQGYGSGGSGYGSGASSGYGSYTGQNQSGSSSGGRGRGRGKY